MTERWQLNRAGILNVYQYGDETLHFGGGRLLLRGVNGSGKSTAMNMLLPFLLDGDVRRIDAAGEQSGVLRSWMLSGRDDQQPIGYLWLELAKGDEHLCFGCGIKANRGTDRVNTWWFVTPRRVGIDLHLVEGRVPLSVEALRTAAEPGTVYREDQRPAYRNDLRNRLFGGAELDEHLRLLRIVRNPRVGDRLDDDLPTYLQDALPQLSEAALDDAAQPLEDLDEHRRTVTDLARTHEALTAITGVYRSYARRELHQAAQTTLDVVAERDRLLRHERSAREAHQQAEQRLTHAEAEKQRLTTEASRLRIEIDSLKGSEAYKAGAELTDLRQLLKGLEEALAGTVDQVAGWQARLGEDRTATERAADEADHATERLRSTFSLLADLAATGGVPARPPGVPHLDHEPPDDTLPRRPTGPLDTSAPKAQLVDLRVAAAKRILDVDTMQAAITLVDHAEAELADAERDRDAATTRADEARRSLEQAEAEVHTAAEDWRTAATDWLDGLGDHQRRHDLAEATIDPDLMADPAGLAAADASVTAPLRAAAETTAAAHQHRIARTESQLAHHDEVVADLEQTVDELAATTLPAPPSQPWQSQRATAALSELVDFAEHLTDAERAGLEAALDASGLLAAEVSADGHLRLADGQLLAATTTGHHDGPSLADLLRVDQPEHHHGVTDDAIRALLGSIAIDLASDRHTAVTTSGEFRVGSLHGRHTKPRAEHIGLTARREALEQQRAAAAAELASARDERNTVAARHTSQLAALEEAEALAKRVPSDGPLMRAVAHHAAAEHHDEAAMAEHDEAEAHAVQVEARLADAVARRQRDATRLGLPSTGRELDEVRDDIGSLRRDVGHALDQLETLTGVVERWIEHADQCERTTIRLEEVTGQEQAARARRDEVATRLATLEDSIGLDLDEVLAALDQSTKDLEIAEAQLAAVDDERSQAGTALGATAERFEHATGARVAAEQRCLDALPHLHRILDVPGLVPAALDEPSTEPPALEDPSTEPDHEPDHGDRGSARLPSVDDSPEGARELSEAMLAIVAPPEAPDTTAESVRISLRRRRDTLGAGWDAEARQPDDQLPLHIQVTGPYADNLPLHDAALAVDEQLAQLSGLLTAKQRQALRNLLQGLVAREVADKLHAAGELVDRMNQRLAEITTAHGIGVSLRWHRRNDLDPDLAAMVALLAKLPDLRTPDEDQALSDALGARIEEARRDEPDLPYRDLIAGVLDYRDWHRMAVELHRPGRSTELLSRRSTLSEGEKKIVTYLPLFAAVAASYDRLATGAPDSPRFVLLDDAFAKVSEDNHSKLFGLLVDLDLDFIATSERLWGTHDTVPELAITEVIRDADLATIVLEHSRWNGRERTP